MNSERQDKPKILVGHVQGDESDLPEGVILHKSRDPDAPDRVDRSPVVVDDPVQIQRTKELFEQRLAQLYDQTLALISQGQWVFSEHQLALTLHCDAAVTALRRMIADESLTPAARTKAAENLITLGDADGEEFLFNVLKSATPELRVAALESLRAWNLEVDFSSTGRPDRILSLLGDSDRRTVEAAARLCAYRPISGAEATLIALLEEDRSRYAVPLAEALAEIATTSRAVDVLLPHVLNDSADQFSHGTAYTFRRLVEHPDPAMSKPIRRALYSYTLRFPKQRYNQSLVRELAMCAGEDATPVLEDILANASDRVSRTYAVEALARLQPEKAIGLLQEHIRREGARIDIVRLVQKHATEADFDRIAPLLVESAGKTGKRLDREIVRLFLTRFGSRGERFVTERMDELDEDARMWAAWKLEGLDLVPALTELYEAEVVRTTPDDLIRKMQAARSREDNAKPLDTSDPDALIGALSWEGILTMFDAETSTIPCHHDRLVLQFADASNGQFTPRFPVQFWHRASDDDYDGPYTVQFVYRDRLFRTGAENYGDWYDVDAIVRLINFALKTAGQSQRFITLDTTGQIASFVFADPAAFLPIAARYRLPLSEDPSKAMRAGIEYERRAIEGSR